MSKVINIQSVDKYWQQFSSVIDGDKQLFINTSNGDCWLECDGELVKQDNVDSTDDAYIISMNNEFNFSDEE